VDWKGAPLELQVAIQEFWPDTEWQNAVNIAELESSFDAFALDDTTNLAPCGVQISDRDGIQIYAERSVGYFQINSCDFPNWEWQRFYNARQNAGTAHMLWEAAGGSWKPWWFSAQRLGLA
jgi:hypothetical protein